MDTPDKAAEIKAAAAALIAFGTALFGWVGWMVVLWLIAMALDYLTGTFAALYNKTWSSAAARRGLWHKLGSIFGVLVAAMCDLVLRLVGDNFGFELPMIGQSCLITPIVAAWYFFTAWQHRGKRRRNGCSRPGSPQKAHRARKKDH